MTTAGYDYDVMSANYYLSFRHERQMILFLLPYYQKLRKRLAFRID